MDLNNSDKFWNDHYLQINMHHYIWKQKKALHPKLIP